MQSTRHNAPRIKWPIAHSRNIFVSEKEWITSSSKPRTSMKWPDRNDSNSKRMYRPIGNHLDELGDDTKTKSQGTTGRVRRISGIRIKYWDASRVVSISSIHGPSNQKRLANMKNREWDKVPPRPPNATYWQSSISQFLNAFITTGTPRVLICKTNCDMLYFFLWPT